MGKGREEGRCEQGGEGGKRWAREGSREDEGMSVEEGRGGHGGGGGKRWA